MTLSGDFIMSGLCAVCRTYGEAPFAHFIGFAFDGGVDCFYLRRALF